MNEKENGQPKERNNFEINNEYARAIWNKAIEECLSITKPVDLNSMPEKLRTKQEVLAFYVRDNLSFQIRKLKK